MAASKPVTMNTISKSTADIFAPKKASQDSNGQKRQSKSEKQMKQIFKGLVMSLSGNFINCDKVEPHEKIAKWIIAHGAEYERVVTTNTTHLICSIEDFKRRTTQVKKCWKLGEKCHIVSFDWIIDCLRGPKGEKRLRNERAYTLERIIKRLKRGKKASIAYREKFEQGTMISKSLCDNNFNHIYYDSDGFEYKIVLTRVNIGIKTYTEKYTLFLFESNAKPHTYMCGAIFSRPGRSTSFYKDKCFPMTFFKAFESFKAFFQQKTGIDWEMRLEHGPRQDDSLFVYTPPKLGRPVGLVPPEYVRPELREPEEDEQSNGDTDEETADDANSEISEVDSEESQDQPDFTGIN